MDVLSDQTLMDDENEKQIEQFKLKKVVNQQPVTETTIQVNKSGDNTHRQRYGSSSPVVEDDSIDEDHDIINRKSPQNPKSLDVKVSKKKYKTPKRREEDKMNNNEDLDEVAMCSSDVSSDEAQDNVGEQPLDVIKIRQTLRRKMTLCPTKSFFTSV